MCYYFAYSSPERTVKWAIVIGCRPPLAVHPSVVVVRFRIEFWPHWISTRGVLIQRVVLRNQRIFHVELRPPRQGVIVLLPLRRIKFAFDIELCWIMTPGLDSTLNYDHRSEFNVAFDPESGINVTLWPGIGITIQYGILTRGHNITSTFDLRSDLRS